MSNILGFKYQVLVLFVTIIIYTFYLFITCEMINRDVILLLAEFYFLLGIWLWRRVPEATLTGLHGPVQGIPDDQLSNMGTGDETCI